MGFVFFLNSLFIIKQKPSIKFWNFKKNINTLFYKCLYIIHWWFLRFEEKKKKIFFEVICNNGSKNNIEILLNLKKIFSKQLPNMPIFYINQVILDIKQESIALIKYNNSKTHLIGGCSYRIFKKQNLIELVFFAIITSEQMKGYGKILMSFLKEKAISLNVKTIITCADNNAIKYFIKQGFSHIITSPIFIWAGYICDYEEIKLMECSLFKNFKYYNSIPFLLTQKLLLYYKSRFISKHNKHFLIKKRLSHPGIFKLENKMFVYKVFHIFSNFSKKRKISMVQQKLKELLNLIKCNYSFNPFLEPVNIKKSKAFDYFKTIFYAVDLRTIEERLRLKTYYINNQFFQKDISHMIQNGIIYNGKSHSISEICCQIVNLINNFYF
jgi:histone acetyltransferase